MCDKLDDESVISLLGEEYQVGGNGTSLHSTDLDLNIDCGGNACADIDYNWVARTNSYHFYNDGERKIKLKVEIFDPPISCGRFRRHRMRPGESWDSEAQGLCGYEADYR